MRSEQDVQDRIRYLLTQEIGHRVKEASSKLPHRCKHNMRHPLDLRKNVDGERNGQYNRITGKSLPVIGLCGLGSEDPSTWPINICDDPVDAQRCPYFDPKDTHEMVQAEFHQQLKDLKWVEDNMPEVAGLLWALGSEVLPELPWWKAIWFRWLRIRPDSLWRRNHRPVLPSGNYL